MILTVLSLIDLSLALNLVLIVIFSGYENFVSKIDTGDSEDRPQWMGTLDFSGMKMKLIGSIVAISAISLLRAFMTLNESGQGAQRLPAALDGDPARDVPALGRAVRGDGLGRLAHREERACDTPAALEGAAAAKAHSSAAATSASAAIGTTKKYLNSSAACARL